MLTPDQIDRVVTGREDDPFATLGVHPASKGFTACVMLPDATGVTALTLEGKAVGQLACIHPDGLFFGKVSVKKRQPLRYIAHYSDSSDYALVDPYGYAARLRPRAASWIARAAVRQDGRPCHPSRRHGRNPFRGLGAQCVARLSGGRL